MSSPRSTCNWAVALLVLWSMVSLVVVVVWASWPPQAGLEGCQRGMQDLVEKLEGARVMKDKELQTVERELQQSWENQSRLQLQIQLLLQDLHLTNLSLADALMEKAILQENMTSLETEMFESMRAQNRLSQEQALNEAEIFALQVNLTSEEHQLDSCMALRDASRSQGVAAESKRKACESKSQYLHKHLKSCKVQE